MFVAVHRVRTMRKLRKLLWVYVKQQRTSIFVCVVFHCIHQLNLLNVIKCYVVNSIRNLIHVENVFVFNKMYRFSRFFFIKIKDNHIMYFTVYYLTAGIHSAIIKNMSS